ncbi:hypothetical protein IAF53_20770, partial [Acinetobacter baumannii]|nr:hypothetical protein [Acinetobacter baumannii]
EPQALLGEDLPAALPAEAPQELVSDVIYQPISSIEPLLYHDALITLSEVTGSTEKVTPSVLGGVVSTGAEESSSLS